MTTDDDGDKGADDTDDVSQYKMEDVREVATLCELKLKLMHRKNKSITKCRNAASATQCDYSDAILYTHGPKTKDHQQQQEQEHHHHNKDIVVLGDAVCPAANGARWVAFYISLDFMRFTLC
ncbi:hypothetical protein ACLKA7_006212 [Drosophila subpalustris]